MADKLPSIASTCNCGRERVRRGRSKVAAGVLSKSEWIINKAMGLQETYRIQERDHDEQPAIRRSCRPAAHATVVMPVQCTTVDVRRRGCDALADRQSNHTGPVEKGSDRHGSNSGKGPRENKNQPHVSALETLLPQAVEADIALAAPAADPRAIHRQGLERQWQNLCRLRQAGCSLSYTSYRRSLGSIGRTSRHRHMRAWSGTQRSEGRCD
jgi:hypothetical protein